MTFWIVTSALVALWILLNLKRSRPDGTFIKGVHKYRQMMWYIMPSRNGSIVYYDTRVRAEPLLEYLDKLNPRFHCDVTHVVVGACAQGLIETPKMNRFVSGRRMYQRRGDFATFAMKRQRGAEEAKLATVKMQFEAHESFRQLCARIAKDIDYQRSGARTSHDKEYDFFTAMPRPMLKVGVRLFALLDYYNILPGGFIRDDPLYTSVFIANLGSLQMAPAFHHLYEWGTCPLFLMVGQIEEQPLVVDGKLEVGKVLPLRWSYDERIDDGITARRGILAVNTVLSDPARYLGCLDPDGKDEHPIGHTRVPPELLAAR